MLTTTMMFLSVWGAAGFVAAPSSSSFPPQKREGTSLRSSMSDATQARIAEMIDSNKVMLFMKGNRMMPQCGFSNMAVQLLNAVGSEYETCDVLSDDAIRSGIKEYSDWPTIPQLYVDGEFVGGSDIMMEMYQDGELQTMIEVAANS